MTGQPYTDADVELIEAAWDEHRVAFYDGLIAECRCGSREDNHAEKVALAALAAAGRLLPAGTETVEQFAARIMIDGEPVFPWPDPITRQGAKAMVKAHKRERAYDPQWRGTAELVHRHQHTTPWTPAEETP
ncbi:hypothetical protein AB0B63_06805 [Micromonospora sp. NPDC049081]|uniref:hypothetical protein n=1 Tax=Micromonospora sp. NPDC049081 TaxID=3155150 RepID=UPI0033E08599